jgi:hypothetical protein
MSPRTVKRRRRRSNAAASATNGSATSLLSSVNELVAENQALVRENKELHSVLARVTQAVQGLRARPVTSRRPTVAGAGPAKKVRPQRRRITDPATLERRRAALAKARQVLADKRAAART